MPKRLLFFLFAAVFALNTAVLTCAIAGEDNPDADAQEDFSPYISLDELQDTTPVDVAAETAGTVAAAEKNADEGAESVKVEGKTMDEMSDDERAAAKYIWEDELYGESFVLQTLNGEPAKTPLPITIEFDENGNIGGRICNVFQGRTEFATLRFKATEIASSRMMCPDEVLANLERDFLRNLEYGMSYQISGDELELRRDNMVLVFRRGKESDEPEKPTAPAPESRPAPVAPAPAPTPAPTPVAAPAPRPAAPAPVAVAQPKPVVAPAPAPVAPIAQPSAPAPAPIPAPAPAPVAIPAPVAPAPQAAMPEPIKPVVSSSGSSDQVVGADLAGRKFVLAEIDGKSFSPDMGEQPFIQFDQGMMVGGKACNNFRGKGELEDGVLTVANAASTMMMCVDSKLNQYENDLHRLLREGADVMLDGNRLTLTGGDREFVYIEY